MRDICKWTMGNAVLGQYSKFQLRYCVMRQKIHDFLSVVVLVRLLDEVGNKTTIYGIAAPAISLNLPVREDPQFFA